MKKEDKEIIPLEINDPKPPVIRCGHGESIRR